MSHQEPGIPTSLYGIIGMPLGHSLSPLIHNRALALTGQSGVYMAWEISPQALAGFITAARTLPISGVSVTIPHKQAVMPLIDGLSSRAKAVGAVNTLHWQDGKLLGDNTDVSGFLAPLRKLPAPPESALVLGVGGAARAVFAGLAELGVKNILACARDENKAQKPCADFKARFVPWSGRTGAVRQSQLIVNATPLGMSGAYQDLSPLDGICLSPNQTIYDLVYNPLRTALLKQAGDHGCRTIDGLEMFTAQAAGQFRLWTGQNFPEQEISRLLVSRLEG
jgi:shikimate dehydrogenase